MTTLVVGCGYLGRRVAARLIARGERVLGTTRGARRAEELIGMGIRPILFDVLGPSSDGQYAATPTPHPNPPPQGGGGPNIPSPLVGEGRVGGGGGDDPFEAGLPDFDRLVYCVGFDREAGPSMRSVYVDGLGRFLDLLEKRSPRFVYTSSTGVYGQDDGSWVSEDDATEPRTESGRVALEAEEVARSRGAIVVRLAGLYGPGRIIRRAALLAGEPIVGDPSRRINLVQIDDAAAAVVAALDLGEPGRVYNVADDRPVERRELYALAAARLGAPEPRFIEPGPGAASAREEADRRVANRRMKEELRVKLDYPDVATGLPASIEAERANPPTPR